MVRFIPQTLMFILTLDVSHTSRPRPQDQDVLLQLSHMGEDCLAMLTCETDYHLTCQATKVNVTRMLASKFRFFTTEPGLLQLKMPDTLILALFI